MGALFSLASNSLPFKEIPFFLRILLPLYTCSLHKRNLFANCARMQYNVRKDLIAKRSRVCSGAR